jgi:hypothetical protein
MRKATEDGIRNIPRTTQNATEALIALTELATAARHGRVSTQLIAVAGTLGNLIDTLARRVGCTMEDVYAPLFSA